MRDGAIGMFERVDDETRSRRVILSLASSGSFHLEEEGNRLVCKTFGLTAQMP